MGTTTYIIIGLSILIVVQMVMQAKNRSQTDVQPGSKIKGSQQKTTDIIFE